MHCQHFSDISVPKRLRLEATTYYMEGEQLRRKGPEGQVLKCIDASKVLTLMAKLHHGICGDHKNGLKIRWLVHLYGFF